ncbi:MAG TPA: hypothetical protein VMU17_08090, partial [Elusimicrobiota bacterium]|nr:hypothetical protein [Elusimicrobiota bacterium]
MRRLALAVWTIGFVASGLSSVKSIGAPAVIPGTIRVCLLHVRRSSTIGCSGEFTYRRKGSRTAVTSRSSINVSPGGRSVKIGSRRLSGTVLVAPVKEGDYLSVNHR